ncbi:hypothetical protein RB596_008770 [Gaeumannomyces avenae]
MSTPGVPAKIAVLSMSTRKPRVGNNIVALVKETLEKEAAGPATYSVKLVDLADFNLPVYDEEVIPAQVPAKAQFKFEHTKRWSAEIASHDAYVLVIPEYNYSIGGGTKNAIDYLYNEWIGKPVAIVSYGIGGGTKASAVAADVLAGMKLRVAETRPAFSFAGGLGPDAFAAMNEGQLGDESRKKFVDETAETVRKAFGEIKTLLEAPVKS